MSLFFESIRALTTKIETALDHGKISLALRSIHDFVERIVTEPICTAQAFASRDLDELCLRIGRHALASLVVPQDNLSPGANYGPSIVYLVSRLQRSGGHSRLIQDFIRSQPEEYHLILSTEVAGPSDHEFLSKLFATKGNVRFVRAPGGNFESRLNWLQSTLLTSQPKHVYLFNHHQDSISVAALVPELRLKGSFCHHGDHHLCLGVHLSHLTHIDFHPMGFHHCRNELGVDNRYLPLTFEDKKCVPFESDFMQGGTLVTATAARSNKVEIPYYVSYLDTIPRVLKATGGRHVHIGKLTPWALLRIYHQMRKQGVQKDRFVYIEWTSSVWKALQAHKVDAYIASFPYGAGLTLIEAMGAGIPLIMHEHMHSRVLSGLELAYPDAFQWSDPEDLLAYLTTLQPERLEHERALSRQQYERYHRPERLQGYLRNAESVELQAPPLASKYRPRYDEFAAWVEAQLSFYRLGYRFLYRGWRRLRRLREFLR